MTGSTLRRHSRRRGGARGMTGVRSSAVDGVRGTGRIREAWPPGGTTETGIRRRDSS